MVSENLMKTLSSSHVAAAGYDSETRELQIDFRGGQRYVYDNVPPDVAEGLFTAPSAGQYLYQNIKERFLFYRI